MGIYSVMMTPNQISQFKDFQKLVQNKKHVLVFVVATYWEGNPTTNAVRLEEWLLSYNGALDDVNYAVFGLGDSGYTYFNAFGKFVDRRMSELGATRVHDLGLGNAALDIEYDFQVWKESFTHTVLSKYGQEPKGQDHLQYELEYLLDKGDGNLYKGEPTDRSSYYQQSPPYNRSNPFLATVVSVEELYQAPKRDRSCMKITINVKGSRFMWSAGDHLGVYVQNNFEDVDRLAKILRIDLSTVIDLRNKDKNEVQFRHRFPCPCSLETVFLFYLDINRPPSAQIIKEIAPYATVSQERTAMRRLGSLEGRDDYLRFVVGGHKTLLQLFLAFPSCRPPLTLLLELLPRLRPRYYSISNSPKVDKDKIVITVGLVRKEIPGNTSMTEIFGKTVQSKAHRFHGVASTYLAGFRSSCKSNQGSLAKSLKSLGLSKKSGPLLPVFHQSGKIYLPDDALVSIIMIGAGTGLSPFIGFIQDREMVKQSGKPIGKTILYFGCRNPNEDYLYGDYLRAMAEAKVLSELNVAFSRINEKKTYVQHLLMQNKFRVWETLEEGNSIIYVCGDADGVAKDVEETIGKIATSCGGWRHGADFTSEMKRMGRYQKDVWTSPFAKLKT